VCIPFADAFQRLLTAHEKPGLCVVCLPAIRAFQRYSTRHLLRYRSPFGFHFCFRSAPSGFVQRTGCSACSLGYPHQVWWAPPMYIARAWPRRASLVCQRTSACSPPGLSPRFLPTAGLYKRLSQKKKGAISAKEVVLPRAHGPDPPFIPSVVLAPPWWWLALRHLARFSFRPQQPIGIHAPFGHPLPCGGGPCSVFGMTSCINLSRCAGGFPKVPALLAACRARCCYSLLSAPLSPCGIRISVNPRKIRTLNP
jgi:hypothetical protein